MQAGEDWNIKALFPSKYMLGNQRRTAWTYIPRLPAGMLLSTPLMFYRRYGELTANCHLDLSRDLWFVAWIISKQLLKTFLVLTINSHTNRENLLYRMRQNLQQWTLFYFVFNCSKVVQFVSCLKFKRKMSIELPYHAGNVYEMHYLWKSND